MKTKKYVLFILCSCSLFAYAGTRTYNIVGWANFKTQALRNNVYNTIMNNIASIDMSIVTKENYSAQTGTTTANAGYRISVCINYFEVDINKRNSIDTAISNIMTNTNLENCNIKIFNSYSKIASEEYIPNVLVKEYIK